MSKFFWCKHGNNGLCRACYDELPTGPTLNKTYNDFLVQNKEYEPVCENCDRDLTGLQVFDVDTMWVCEGCFHTVSNDE